MLLSVGDVLVGDDLLWRYPYQQLALHRVAPTVLLSPVCAHVAATEARRPVEQVGIIGGKVGGAFDQDEVEGWFFLVDAKADTGIPEHVASLEGALSGRENQSIAVQVEPDRGRVGPAVGAYGGEDRRPGAVEHELSVFFLCHPLRHVNTPPLSTWAIYTDTTSRRRTLPTGRPGTDRYHQCSMITTP